jgi:predicted porin
MKKSLIALAVAAVLPATAMAASQVRMYGIADVYVGYSDPDVGDGSVVVNSGGQSTSRWGVDGSEDLGGGLSGVFKLEAGLNMDEGRGQSGAVNGAGTSASSVDFRRRSYVGLKGGFGQLVLGRTFTPIFWTLLENDAGGMAHSVTDWPGGAVGRWDNGIHYDGKFGPVKLYAAYSTEENTGDDGVGIGARFNIGGFGASLAYQDNFGDKWKQAGINGSFGPVKVGLNYSDADSFDNRFGLSVNFKIGASGSILFNMVDQSANAGGADSTNYQLFYRQGLSKRTNWYAGVVATNDGDDRSFRLGVRHRF